MVVKPATVHHLNQVSSVLDVIHQYAARGAPGGTAVVAREQLEGRGTRGRPWHSPPGGLWFGILLNQVPEKGMELLGLRVGIGVARAVESVVPGLRLGLKWPNDFMLGEKKMGGVLCEARWQGPTLAWVAVGIGLNVANRIPAELSETAAALNSVARELTPDALVEPITSALWEYRYAPGDLTGEELTELGGRDWLQGRELREPVAGIARGIQPDGSLRVEQADGSVVPVKAGHVILR